MSDKIEIPISFFKSCQLGMSSAEDELEMTSFDAWNGSFDFLDGEIDGLAASSSAEGTTEHLQLALEYFIAANDEDLPQNIRPHGLGLGEMVGYEGLSALSEEALHQLAAYVRRRLFPDLPEMSASDKLEALKRVRLTDRDLRDWMYHLVFPDEPPLTREQCDDPQAMGVTEWMRALRKQKETGGPHWPEVPIVFPPLPRAK
jgi:hypothetical protein